MDYKLRASGETEEYETLQRNESSTRKIVTPEYATSLIEWLETFTGKKLNPTEMELWTARLLKYPHWKLDRTTEYTGTMTNEYFRFLDAMQYQELVQHYTSLPEPKTGYAKELNKMIQGFNNFDCSTLEGLEAKRTWEKAEWTRIAGAYPHHATMIYHLLNTESRFQ